MSDLLFFDAWKVKLEADAFQRKVKQEQKEYEKELVGEFNETKK